MKLRDLLVGKDELYNCFLYSQGSYDDFHTSDKYKMLSFAGFTIKMKPIKLIPNPEDSQNPIRRKCDIDVELTIDAITTVKNFDTAYLITGDGDFCELVKYLRFQGKEIICVSTRKTCAIDLRNIADKFIDLRDIIKKIKM